MKQGAEDKGKKRKYNEHLHSQLQPLDTIQATPLMWVKEFHCVYLA